MAILVATSVLRALQALMELAEVAERGETDAPQRSRAGTSSQLTTSRHHVFNGLFGLTVRLNGEPSLRS